MAKRITTSRAVLLLLSKAASTTRQKFSRPRSGPSGVWVIPIPSLSIRTDFTTRVLTSFKIRHVSARAEATSERDVTSCVLPLCSAQRAQLRKRTSKVAVRVRWCRADPSHGRYMIDVRVGRPPFHQTEGSGITEFPSVSYRTSVYELRQPAWI